MFRTKNISYFFSSNVSENSNYDNAILLLFHPNSIPYDDNIPGSDISGEIEVEYNTDNNENVIGYFEDY